MQKWQILEEQDVSPHPRWLPVFRHKIQLENGDVVDDFYSARLGDIVSILAMTKNKEIVFVRQYRHAVGQILLELPAGMVENDESLKAVAIKELKEETGIQVNQEELVELGISYPIPHKVDMKVNGFLVKDVEFNVKQELDRLEDIEVVTIPVREVIEKVKNNELLQPDTVAFIMRAYLLYPELFA